MKDKSFKGTEVPGMPCGVPQNMYQYKLANNLCRICDEQNISLDELAERIGKSSRQVSRYRNGESANITLSTLEDIANVLGVHLFELLK